MGFKTRSSNPCVNSGADFANTNANYGLSYFGRNTTSNTNTNIGGRHLSQRKKPFRIPLSSPLGEKYLERGTG